MTVVSDSSPLVILTKLGYFDLLNRLFSRVYISAEVHDEVVVVGTGLPGAAEVSNAKWIEVKQLQNPASLLAAQQKQALGLGEISTILLANSVRILCCSMTTRHACLPRPKASRFSAASVYSKPFTPGAI